MDITPDNSNKIAYVLGYIFHPFVMGVIGLAAVLRLEKLAFGEAIAWLVVLSLILIVPLVIAIQYFKRQEKYTYQRHARTPIYLIGWLAMLVCTTIVSLQGNLPHIAACLASLVVWIPMQVVINRLWTKVSAHSAVTMGVSFGLLWLGVLDTPLLKFVAMLTILLTAWARITTRNHTPPQILLGWLVAVISIGVTFPIFVP